LARYFGTAAEPSSPESSGASAPSGLNWKAALRSVNGNERLLHEVVQAFVDDVPRLLQAAHNALQHDNADGLRAAAHALKGSMLFLQAEVPIEIAQELETRAHDEPPDRLAATLAALTEHVEALLSELRARLTGVPSWQKC
jgi:HPt (histidine-containing phosphotransfer) domain-containing protein